MLLVVSLVTMTTISCGGDDGPTPPPPSPSSGNLTGIWTYIYKSGYREITFNADGTGSHYEIDSENVQVKNNYKFTYTYNNGIVSISYENGKIEESTISWQNENTFTSHFNGDETWNKKPDLTDDQIKSLLIGKIWMLETDEYYVYVKYYDEETYTEDYPYKEINETEHYYTVVDESYIRYKSKLYGSDNSIPSKWQYRLEKGRLNHSVGSYNIVSIKDDELVLSNYGPPSVMIYKAVSNIPPVGAFYNKPIGENIDNSGSLNGHEYVDLGLPSGTLWATCNVGASKPEQYGYYYSWGETIGYNSVKTNFDYWNTYKWCKGSYDTMTKYCTDIDFSNGAVDNKTTLDLTDDAATANWGSRWCMPTYAQISELRNSSYTTSAWVKVEGIYGRKITSKINGNTIFLPAAGYSEKSLLGVGEYGGYWSRTLDSSHCSYAYSLKFSSKDAEWGSGSPFSWDDEEYGDARWVCLSVRPVLVQK